MRVLNFFKAYIFGLMENIYDFVTSTPDGVDDLLAYKRIEITTFACRMGYRHCVDRSLTFFREWMSKSQPDKYNK